MKVHIDSVNAVVELTKKQFATGFLYPGDEGAHDFLSKQCDLCSEIDFDGMRGPFVFFTAPQEKFERAKAQMVKAIHLWLEKAERAEKDR